MRTALIVALALCFAYWLGRRSLRAARRTGQQPAPPKEVELSGMEIVGESHYQGALERLAGGRTADGVDVPVRAFFTPERDNPHDPNAVAVTVSGEQVGYLSRASAAVYRGALGAAVSSCEGRIVGGWDRGAGDRGFFGLRLDE